MFDRLELKVPPPVVTLLVGVLMWGAARAWPACGFELPGRGVLTAVFVLAGIALVGASAQRFRRAGTTMNPMRPHKASALVDTGFYRYSRNPIYLGDGLILAGWGLWLANGVSLALIGLFVWYLNRFQIGPEERALRAAFGDAFDAYRRRVRRWI